MIAYAIAGFVIAVGSFIAGAYYGKKWEQEAVAEIVKMETFAVQYLRNRIAKYL